MSKKKMTLQQMLHKLDELKAKEEEYDKKVSNSLFAQLGVIAGAVISTAIFSWLQWDKDTPDVVSVSGVPVILGVALLCCWYIEYRYTKDKRTRADVRGQITKLKKKIDKANNF